MNAVRPSDIAVGKPEEGKTPWRRRRGPPILRRPATMQNITPFLWFNKQAEQAAKFYTSVFQPAKILELAAAR